MKTPKPPESMSHPGELLLLYAENSLASDDARSVKQHLSECPECAVAVEKLAETIRALKAHGEAFCPEPWELYEFVVHGEDPEESIERHLQRCGPCRSLSEMWASQRKSAKIPEQLLAQISDGLRKEDLEKDRIAGRGFQKSPHPSPLPEGEGANGLDASQNNTITIRTRDARFRDRIFKRFMFPTLGIATAAAAILVVFLLVPGEIPQSLVAPSAVTWEEVPKPKAFQTSRYRTAILIALKGFPTRWSQPRVDELYRTLIPSIELSQRFDILPPGLVSGTILKGRKGIRTKEDMLALLRKDLDVKRVAVVVVSPAQDQLKIQGELIDTQGPVSLSKTKPKLVAKKNLDTQIKQMVTDLMISKGR